MNKKAEEVMKMLEEYMPKESKYTDHLAKWSKIFTRAEEILCQNEEYLEMKNYNPKIIPKLIAYLREIGNGIDDLVDIKALDRQIFKIKTGDNVLGILFGLRLLFVRLISLEEWPNLNLTKEEFKKIDDACMRLLSLALDGVDIFKTSSH
jgi:hypothetical protein